MGNSGQSFEGTSKKVYNMLNEYFPEYAWLVVFSLEKPQKDYRGITSPGRHRILDDWEGRNIVIFMIDPTRWPNKCIDSQEKVRKMIRDRISKHEGRLMRKDLPKWGDLIKKNVNQNVRFITYYDRWWEARWAGTHCKLSHPFKLGLVCTTDTTGSGHFDSGGSIFST